MENLNLMRIFKEKPRFKLFQNFHNKWQFKVF